MSWDGPKSLLPNSRRSEGLERKQSTLFCKVKVAVKCRIQIESNQVYAWMVVKNTSRRVNIIDLREAQLIFCKSL